MKTISIKSHDGYDLACYLWDDVKEPKGILQLSHGMAEHAKRYDRFGKYMNERGYYLFANDQRAHGASAGSPEKVGKVVSGDLFQETVLDQLFLTDYIEKEFNLPLFFMGHSMGSFVAQRYIQLSQKPRAVILMGSAHQKNPLTFFAKIIANITCFFKGKDAPAKLIFKLSFDSYEKEFEDRMWLTSDEAEFKKYCEDEFCGAVFSAGFYKYFFKNIRQLPKKSELEKIPKEYPLFILSGADDPVGGKGKFVQKLFDSYKTVGLKNVQMKLYDKMRHEVLNEIGYEEVQKDVADFLDKN